MTRCACKGAELSCIIGNIFTELRPPCDMCGGEAVSIHGITPTGHEATITLTAAGFDFEGCAEDTALLQRIRKARCIYAGTREGTQRAVRIQCDCEGERPCKAKPLMRGDDVKALQTALIERNYHCGTNGADGTYGRLTAYAVRCFQASKGLIVNGRADRYTIAALGGTWKE